MTIHRESWYREALETEHELEQKKLRMQPEVNESYLVEDAIKSWRMGKPSELERRVLGNPELFDLLMLTAKRADYLPYLHMPQVFYTSKGLTEEQREEVMQLAFSKVQSRDPKVRAWLFYHVNEWMQFEKADCDILVETAVGLVDSEPELLTKLIEQEMKSTWFSVLGSASEGFRESAYKAALPLGEKYRDAQVLSWLWDSEVYKYFNDDGEPPDLSWGATFATPDGALPSLGYKVKYYDLLPGNDYWTEDEGDSGNASFKEFLQLFRNWDQMGWEENDVGEWSLTSGEHEVTEDEDQGPYYQQTRIFVDAEEPIIEWLQEHWPPPVSGNSLEETPAEV